MFTSDSVAVSRQFQKKMAGSLGLDLRFIAAPMVNQSDLPFRSLVCRHGATVAYTQMYIPEKLLNDRDYFEYHLRDLTLGADDPFHRPVVAQLCGNNPDLIVQAGRKLQAHCDAIGSSHCPLYLLTSLYNRTSDLNLGCPQTSARDGHYGGYLLGQKDWRLVESIGRAHK
jgi:tRNA-dihydrouridine synthase 1